MAIVSNAICIPRIDSSIQKTFILNVFQNLQIGTIEGIIEIPFKDSPKYKRIIVRVQWNDTDKSAFFLDRFQKGQNVKLVYNPNSPWFWICVPNRIHCRVTTSQILVESNVQNGSANHGDSINPEQLVLNNRGQPDLTY